MARIRLILRERDPKIDRKYVRLRKEIVYSEDNDYDYSPLKRGIYNRIWEDFCMSKSQYAVIEIDKDVDPCVVYRGLKTAQSRMRGHWRMPGVGWYTAHKQGGLVWLSKVSQRHDFHVLDECWWDYTSADDMEREYMEIHNCTKREQNRLYYLRARDGEYMVRIRFNPDTGIIRLENKWLDE